MENINLKNEKNRLARDCVGPEPSDSICFEIYRYLQQPHSTPQKTTRPEMHGNRDSSSSTFNTSRAKKVLDVTMVERKHFDRRKQQ